MPQWFVNTMEHVLDFSNILNASIAASWMVLAVILLRLILKKAPRWTHVALWGLVAVRLLLPFSIESPFSLIPSTETVPQAILVYEGDALQAPASLDIVSNPVFPESVTVDTGETVDRVQVSMVKLTPIWIAGMTALLLYTTVSYWRLKRKVSEAVILRDNIYQSENVGSPFVLGMIKPKIYLPYHMDGQNLSHVVAHEQAHIRRRDHWWKPLGFLLLTVHWFNPLMWLAYVLLCRDIELACDEKVIKELGNEQRADYTQALVACSVGRRMIAACPLAFGEVGVKARVKSVMNYKKPAFWVVVLAVIACVVVAVCFLTNPVSKNTIVLGANYDIEEVLYAVTVGDEISTEPPLQYCVTADYHLYYQQTESEDWNYLGALEPYKLTNDELNSYMPVDEMRKDVKLRQITDSYILKVADDNFYLVFQTKNGKTYLAYGWEDVGEHGQAGSDDTRLRRLYLLDSSFHSGYVNINFFQRSLINTVGNYVYSFANFESDRIPGYHITGFKSGDSNNHTEMNDLGFAVFQTTGEGYRLIDCKVYENAALVENGIFFCSDPAVADVNGEMRNDNTFDILLILNEDVDKVERVYHADGKDDFVQADTYINAPYMSVWSWEHSEVATSVSQYVYDKAGNKLSYNSVIPLNSASWKDLPNSTDGAVTKWFDYLEAPEEMPGDGHLEINLPEFPDVTFRWYAGKMEAVTENGITPLYTGMPIWNTYFCDLTGDGLPDLCSTYTFGSGMIDSRIIIYDYANGASYELMDRGNHDFTLRFDEESGRLWVDKKVYNSDELVSSGYLVFADGCLQVTEKSSDSLDAAISNAILGHYRTDEPDGLIHVESHVLLANETVSGTPKLGADNHMEKTTVYLLVFHEKYSTYGGTLEAVGGSYVPAALTFTISDSGEYILEEYWEPRDGGYYADDVRDKFPGASADDALNDQAYIEDLEAQNYSKALAYMNSTGSLDTRIAELLDEICSSPSVYTSGPDKYLEAHESEYQELLDYGEYTLRYCFTEFLNGGKTDLRGQIMALGCQDIMLAWGEGYAIDQDPITGQDWFDEFRENAESLSNQFSREDLEKSFPGSFLLLQLIESTHAAEDAQH